MEKEFENIAQNGETITPPPASYWETETPGETEQNEKGKGTVTPPEQTGKTSP